MQLLKKLFIKPLSLVLVFAVTATVVMAFTIVEMRSSKAELMELMSRAAHLQLQTIIASSTNILRSDAAIDTLLKAQLLRTAIEVRDLYNNNTLTDAGIKQIAEREGTHRINILSYDGTKLFSSKETIHPDSPDTRNPLETLNPIFVGDADTLLIGLLPSRHNKLDYRYAVAVATDDYNAVVVSLNANEIKQFKASSGFASLLKELSGQEGILFIALQDTNGIVAATGKTDLLTDVDFDSFVESAFRDSVFAYRINEANGTEFFEAVHPFNYADKFTGVVRIGLSTDTIAALQSSGMLRLAILAIVLILFGSVTLFLIISKQNYSALAKDFKEAEMFSANMLESINDPLLMLDKSENITPLNPSAQALMQNSSRGYIVERLKQHDEQVGEITLDSRNGQELYLFSKSYYLSEEGKLSTIAILKDITEFRTLEKKLVNNERLAAMGQMAGTVAHEIRNPLNTIGIIAQQLTSDFTPIERSEQYQKLTTLVHTEVKRLNGIIENFLRFAKLRSPEPIPTDLHELFEITQSYYSVAKAGDKLQFVYEPLEVTYALYDKELLHQALLGIIDNALEAVDATKGEVTTRFYNSDVRFVCIEIKDNGEGIPPEKLPKIFNLFFTTKTKGSGIGLSVAHKIVSEHSGRIEVDSTPGVGTSFKIFIPKK